MGGFVGAFAGGGFSSLVNAYAYGGNPWKEALYGGLTSVAIAGTVQGAVALGQSIIGYSNSYSKTPTVDQTVDEREYSDISIYKQFAGDGAAVPDGREGLGEDFYEYQIRKMDEQIEMDRLGMKLALIKAGEASQTGMKLGLKAFFIWGVGRGAYEAYSNSASPQLGSFLRFLWRTIVIPTQVSRDPPREKIVVLTQSAQWPIDSDSMSFSSKGAVTRMPSDFFDLFSFLLDLFFSPCPRKAEKLQQIPLDEMIKQSKIVVIGKVLRIEEPIFRGMAAATIEIEQIIAGNYEDKQIDITYNPGSTFDARLVLNERCIFMVDERNTIVKGYAGKIPIEKDKVEVRYILGEPTSQTLKDFTNRIKDSKSRQGAIRNP